MVIGGAGGGSDRQLPVGFRITLDRDIRFWAGGRLVTGGSPWRLVRFSGAAVPFLSRLRQLGDSGLACGSALERTVGRALVDRGLAHPVTRPRTSAGLAVVVIPALDRTHLLDRCLATLEGLDAVVVDDGSRAPDAVRAVCERHGARVVHHRVNRGPAAARNTGLRATRAPFVAFVDSDCATPEGWLDRLTPHFDDPLVGAVAPRVVPNIPARSVLGRHEAARSALDMGTRPERVVPGGRLGFLPSAVLVVRRAALARSAFDDALRVGEDVDLVWRLHDAGWHVRYEPSVQVTHEPRLRFFDWLRRRFEYGTSAADLAHRHPGRLAPARLSAWNLASLALLATRRPLAAAAVTTTAAALLSRRLSGSGGNVRLPVSIVGQGLFADAVALGHALRRELWPFGLLALAAMGRSTTARIAAGCMLTPIAIEWVRHRPGLDPARYAALRLIEDAAYGTGVIASAWRARTAAPLLPQVRLPESAVGRVINAAAHACSRPSRPPLAPPA